MANHRTRRDFLRRSAAVSAAFTVPTIIPARALGKDGGVAPSERITLGVIGIGPRCRYVLKGMLGHEDMCCVAISDVQASRRDVGKQLVDDHYGNDHCASYTDFRDVLARDDIDAILAAPGDRWHAPMAVMAMRAGKDIYCEKPGTLTIDQGKVLVKTARR